MVSLLFGKNLNLLGQFVKVIGELVKVIGQFVNAIGQFLIAVKAKLKYSICSPCYKAIIVRL